LQICPPAVLSAAPTVEPPPPSKTLVLAVGEITTVEWHALHDKQPYPGQKYRAWLEDGTYVVEASWQPFCDGARELLAMGFDPKSTLVIKRHGSDVISLKGVLSEVAKVSVHEGRQGQSLSLLKNVL
jgi:hypothetical protein